MIAVDVAEKTGTSPKRTSETERQKSTYLLLGDFGARMPMHATPVDRDNLDEVLARFNVNLAELRILELEDFHPDRLVHSMESLMTGQEPEAVHESAAPRANLEEILRPSGLLEQIAEGGDPFQRYLGELARAHAAPAKKDDSARIAALTGRMRDLLHHPRFQTVEAAWRGLDLVTRGMEDEVARVYIVQFSRADLDQDLAQAGNLRATEFFKLLTSRDWRAAFGLYSFGGSAGDIEMLGRIALIASHARAAFVAEGSADMGDHFEELKQIPESAYLGLALPRMLLRLPYGARTARIESFAFEEMPATPVHAHFLWGNPALAVLAIAARGGVENDELDLERMPMHTYESDGEWQMTPCAEVFLSERQTHALMKMGLMPLVSFRNLDRVRLAGVRAINGSALRL